MSIRDIIRSAGFPTSEVFFKEASKGYLEVTFPCMGQRYGWRCWEYEGNPCSMSREEKKKLAEEIIVAMKFDTRFSD